LKDIRQTDQGAADAVPHFFNCLFIKDSYACLFSQ